MPKEMSQSIHNRKDDINIYFCNPYHSWEKGSIENFNGQMRRRFPKGTDFTLIPQAEINNVAEWINNLFREVLDFQTSNEMYNGFIQS
jgi:IS30 family transposase